MDKPKPDSGPDEQGYYHCKIGSTSCASKYCDHCPKTRDALRDKARKEQSKQREWIRNNVKLS